MANTLLETIAKITCIAYLVLAFIALYNGHFSFMVVFAPIVLVSFQVVYYNILGKDHHLFPRANRYLDFVCIYTILVCLATLVDFEAGARIIISALVLLFLLPVFVVEIYDRRKITA